MGTVTNNDLQLAMDFVRFTNRNIFLTGKAGTGKTTFLRDLKNFSSKRMVVVAPTGVAAINAQGVTIHSFFQLPFHPYIPTFYLPENFRGSQADQANPAGYKMSREKINIIRSLDLLIIDEISMVRADTLDSIDSALRRYKSKHLPFGGVQLLMIGDLQQLAPVVKEDDREIMQKYYDSFFFFGSKALCSTDYVTIELKHIYRQSDQTFIELLNKIRENHIDNEALSELNKRYIPDFDPDSGGGYITLTTHNNQAKALNDSKLHKLPGKTHSLTAVIKDEFPELSYPNEKELILKEGAQVMFVKNDLSGEKLFFNGKIGKVVSFDDDEIIVKCPDDDFPITVKMAEWQNMKYTLNEETKEIEETVIGTFIQYPLRLAWAITIHKSQGLTFERAVIDANAAFAHGQVYVALSRCRSLGGLVLSSRIGQRSIIDNPSITEFINKSVENQPGQSQLEAAKKDYQQQLLSELFDFSPLVYRLSYCLKIIDEHKGSILGKPQEIVENMVSSFRLDLIEVSDKFQPHLKLLLTGEIDAESNIPLQDRVKKAAEYFIVKLEDSMKHIMAGFRFESDNKAVRKSLSDAVERLKNEGVTKLACLNSVRSGFSISKYLEARAKSAIEVPSVKTHSAKMEDDDSGIIQHPDLFKQLKSWRNEKAIALNLPHYMILPQKTMVSISNFLPQTHAALNLVKGMGKKKAAVFGEEILEIIITYCSDKNIEPPHLIPANKKAPKKPREDTKKISYDLFRSGKSIAQIAEERGLINSTIENHLAHYVGTGEIPVFEMVSKEKVELISGYFDGSDDFIMRPVKESLGDKVSWSEIRFVINHLIYLRSK